MLELKSSDFLVVLSISSWALTTGAFRQPRRAGPLLAISTNYLSVVQKSRSAAAQCTQAPFGSPEMQMEIFRQCQPKSFSANGKCHLLVQLQSSVFQPPRKASSLRRRLPGEWWGGLFLPNLIYRCLALAVLLGELGTSSSFPLIFPRMGAH